MTDPLSLAIEAFLEMGESFQLAARNPALEPMAQPLRDRIWLDLNTELIRAGLSLEEALRLYAEERRKLSSADALSVHSPHEENRA